MSEPSTPPSAGAGEVAQGGAQGSAEGAEGPTGKPGRYQRSAGGMVGAMLLLLLVIGAFVAFRALTRDDVAVEPDHVDYLAIVRTYQESGVEVVYPTSLPKDWQATGAEVTPGKQLDWSLRTLTPEGEFAGVRESTRELDALITTYVDEHAERGDDVTIDSAVAGTWQQWSDAGGDTAYAARLSPGLDPSRPSWVLVFGSATPEQLRELAGRLTQDPVPRS